MPKRLKEYLFNLVRFVVGAATINFVVETVAAVFPSEAISTVDAVITIISVVAFALILWRGYRGVFRDHDLLNDN